MKKFLIGAAVLALIFILVARYQDSILKKGEAAGSQREIIKQQEQQIEIKNEVIQTKIFQQKLATKPSAEALYTDSVSSIGDVRSKWLQFFYKERDTASF